VNADQVAALRELLAPSGWLDRTRYFGRALRDHCQSPEGLLIVGTPQDEPWHMTAHLADESRLAGLPWLVPTLLRWAPPRDAPPHLRIGVERLESAGRDETLLVVSAQPAPASMLQRLEDARKTGVTIFALDQGDPELDDLAHEALVIAPGAAPVSFDGAQHLVSAAAGEPDSGRHGTGRPGRSRSGDSPEDAGPAAADGSPRSRVSLRGRLAQVLDAVSGTPVD
jgi:hypothetical protein